MSAAAPWYRVGMAWMLVAIPATAVVLGISLLVLAIRSWDGLVVDDYSRYGKEINRVLVRDHYAAEHGVTARLDYQAASGAVTVSVQAGDLAPASALTALFLHPTRRGLDRELLLGRGPDGRYHGVMSTLPAGRWHVQLGTESWRLGTRVRMHGDVLGVDLAPVAR